jgi:hypothetical protein
LVRRCRHCPVDFSKGSRFHGSNGVRVGCANLVLELSLIMIAVLGWQFMVAEAIAALIMVAILVLLLRSESERKNAQKQMSDFIDDYQGHRAQRDACFVQLGHEHRRGKRAMHGFRPLHDRVLVRRIEAEEKTPAGIIIPDTAKEKPWTSSAMIRSGRPQSSPLIGDHCVPCE